MSSPPVQPKIAKAVKPKAKLAAKAGKSHHGLSDAERLFTPSRVDPARCRGRVWSGGKGGQCHNQVKKEQRFCGFHADKQSHGSVDGPIPPHKLKQFLAWKRAADRAAAEAKPAEEAKAAEETRASVTASGAAAKPAVAKGRPRSRRPEAEQKESAQCASAIRSVLRDKLHDIEEELAAARAEAEHWKSIAGRAVSERDEALSQLKFTVLVAGVEEAPLPKASTVLPALRSTMAVRAAELRGFLVGSEGNPAAAIPATVIPKCITPFSVLAGRLSREALSYLLGAEEWKRPLSAWLDERPEDCRPMGFEYHAESLEEYRHCCSQEAPSRSKRGFFLYGRDASAPCVPRIMAFRHAFMVLNGARLRRLEEQIAEVLAAASRDERSLFGLLEGQALNLCRHAFSVATLQLRWGAPRQLAMTRHVDGGASLLHMSVALAGCRTVTFEHLDVDGKTVKTFEADLKPGDVYVSSPACCYHSVAYKGEQEDDDGAASAAMDTDGSQPFPSTIIVHLRSNMLRLRNAPQWFHRSNKLLSNLAPVVARMLAAAPLELPSLLDIQAAAKVLKMPLAGDASGTSVASRCRSPSQSPTRKWRRGFLQADDTGSGARDGV
eukprot:TRINITY_DN29867_c0_g1_i1.p1 TRINITY_DN29867_c0_g1~~TRINITY_DN29867_c0_g1_i1.p1  ORF type:complete len:608 (+),score=144.64 TRINITY_DN29867_c0_g1_i1:181-2004(+)